MACCSLARLYVPLGQNWRTLERGRHRFMPFIWIYGCFKFLLVHDLHMVMTLENGNAWVHLLDLTHRQLIRLNFYLNLWFYFEVKPGLSFCRLVCFMCATSPLKTQVFWLELCGQQRVQETRRPSPSGTIENVHILVAQQRLSLEILTRCLKRNVQFWTAMFGTTR